MDALKVPELYAVKVARTVLRGLTLPGWGILKMEFALKHIIRNNLKICIMELKTKKDQQSRKFTNNDSKQKKIVNELKNESFGNWLEGDGDRGQVSINELKKESFGNWLEN